MLNYRKKLLPFLLLTLMAFAYGPQAFATTDPVAVTMLRGQVDSIQVNNSITTSDLNFYTVPLSIEQTYKVQNIVYVGIDETSPYFVKTDFAVTLGLEITATNAAGTDSVFNKSFTVTYKMADSVKNTVLQYLRFTNGFKVKVKITSITPVGTITWDYKKVLIIKNELAATRDYVFNCTRAMTATTIATATKYADDAGVSWADPGNGQTEYDLEWAWIDESAYTFGLIDQQKIFNNNSTRVTITRNQYNIPLFYDGDGRIFVRVRPVQTKENGQRIEGQWSTTSASDGVDMLGFSGHESKLNWQASTSYAEEGKRKSVVQYFDGTLRNRQTVTKDNSTATLSNSGTTVVAETMYDYQGRAVIQVLPSPTLNTIIAYSHNFNQAVTGVGYPKSMYDKLNGTESACASPAPAMSTATGTSNYYSPANPDAATGMNQFIPDAEGFPFTETRFKPDGNVAAQGGVGVNHRLGSGHETKYTEEVPAQSQLDRLFGTEAGVNTHYTKNWVKDANGQYSVSYVDMHGRTVATALAGTAPSSLGSIATPVDSVKKSLLDASSNIVNGRSIISTSSMVLATATTVKFEYKLTPEQLKLFNCNAQQICYDCLYDLFITITPECTENAVTNFVSKNFTLGQYAANHTCSANSPKFDTSFTRLLNEGSYTITKELRLSNSAQDYLRDSIFMPNNTCKTLAQYITAQQSLVLSQANCNITCQTCNAALGNNFSDFVTSTLTNAGMTIADTAGLTQQFLDAYNNTKAGCDRICNANTDDGMGNLRNLREIMLLDMTPPFGQYAKTETAYLGKRFNIFNAAAPVAADYYFGFVTTPVAPFYLNPVNRTSGDALTPDGYVLDNKYKDFSGAVTLNTSPPVSATNLPPADFAFRFRSEYANALLPYHPEYHKLIASETTLAPAYRFEGALNDVNDWTTALSKDYINNIVSKDSFFSNIAPALASSMQAKINTQFSLLCGGTTYTLSMWQVALSSVFCRSTVEQNTIPCGTPGTLFNTCAASLTPVRPAGNTCADWNYAWQAFKTSYIGARKIIIDNYLATTLCTDVNTTAILTESISSTPIYKLRFPVVTNSSNGITELNDIFTQVGTGNYPAATTAASTAAQQQYESACAGYSGIWYQRLMSCPGIAAGMTQADSTWLINNLISICTKGADGNHPMGSSSIKPGTAPVHDAILGDLYEFPDVIRQYLIYRGIITTTPVVIPSAECHPYLIESPKPYDRQPALVSEPVVTKPSDCECDRLSQLKNEYASSGYSGTFSAFISYKYQVTITQGALDTLGMLCNNTYGCKFIPGVIMLPPVFQCHGNATDTKVCIECEDIRAIKTDFNTQFNSNAPVRIPTTDSDIAINRAFEQYANYRTGFSKSITEYITFLDSCKIGTACDSLSTLVTSFQQYYFAGQNGMAYRNLKINPVVDEMILGYNGLLERRRMSSFGTPLSTRYHNQPLNMNANNKFYSVSHSIYSGTDSLFNLVQPINVDYVWFYTSPATVAYLPTFKANQVVGTSDFWHTPSAAELSKKYYGYNMMEEWGRFRLMFSEMIHWQELDGTLASEAGYYGLNAPHVKFLMPDPPAPRSSLANAYYMTAFFKIPEPTISYADYTTRYDAVGSIVSGPDDDRLPGGVLRDSLKLSNRIYHNIDIKRVVEFSIDKRLYDQYIAAGSPIDHLATGRFMRAKLELMNGTYENAYFWTSTNLFYKQAIDSNLYNPNCNLAFAYYYNQQMGTSYTYAQIDSIYFVKCGSHPTPCTQPVDCAPLNKIVSDYYHQYVQPDSGYADLDIRTFAGNKTPDAGPKGVFDVNKNLIGKTVATGTDLQIKQSFASIWNSNTANQLIGTLAALSNGKMRLTLNPGKQVPCEGIIGMRYYTFDVPVDTLDAAIVGEGCYVDFGDGHTERIFNGLHVRSTEVYDANFTNEISSYTEGINDTSIQQLYVIHMYPNNTVKTVTVFHPDVRGVFGFNFAYSGAPRDIAKLRNLKGYMPQETFRFEFASTQDSTLNSVDSIKNFTQVNSITDVVLHNGNGLLTSTLTELRSTHFSSFANNPHLRNITFDQGNFPTYQHQTFNNLFPNIPVNFRELNSVEFQNYMGEYTNAVNFSTPNIKFLYLIRGSLTRAQVDTIIIQMARTTRDSGAIYFEHSNGTVRTSASNAAVTTLTNKKWELSSGGMNNDVPDHQVIRPMRDTIPVTNNFTDYYNAQNGTSYDYLTLKAFLQGKYGYTLNPCAIVPVACTGKTPPRLCGLNQPVFADTFKIPDPCRDLVKIATGFAEDQYDLYKDSLRNVFDTAYTNKCLAAKNLESFTASYITAEYHYTLYYYDQAGNLTKTVPPNGVDIFSKEKAFSVDSIRKVGSAAVLIPGHTMATNYRYNTLNQVIAQNTPDAGLSQFWYDRLGRLVVSQNSRQLSAKAYSYTLYDTLGRITEVGEKPKLSSSPLMTQIISQDEYGTNGLRAWLAINGTTTEVKQQITRTVYDVDYTPLAVVVDGISGLYQKNLRNRVSYTYIKDKDNQADSWNAATFYSYDIHGNVDTLLQDYKTGMGSILCESGTLGAGNRYKKMVYKYDLISGKVNEVAYQPGLSDAFYHRYAYDAENRITNVQTSTDKLYWETDASYNYYKHGPLARTVIGQNRVQGLDFAYTLQGWLKGVNGIAAPQATSGTGVDMGRDGLLGGQVAKDAFSFGLHYYEEGTSIVDYKTIKSNTSVLPFPNPNVLGTAPSTGISLYNGNIAAMDVNIPKAGVPQLYKYQYDQLNRLLSVRDFRGLNTATNTWGTPTATTDYNETITYDPNGNIRTYVRNGTVAGGGQLLMDSLNYQYPRVAGATVKTINNRLRYVYDPVNAANYTEDIDKNSPAAITNNTTFSNDRSIELTTDNYVYDAIGNLVQDKAEYIYDASKPTRAMIEWNVYGKITKIVKRKSGTDSTVIQYTYDASGNRISKDVNGKKTFYVRDASGNVMSLYQAGESTINSGNLTQTELHLYGSSRLGIYNVSNNVQCVPAASSVVNFIRGMKSYELGNHLGNVLAAISDRKIAVDNGTYNTTTWALINGTPDGLVDLYTADVLAANDYYAFGMLMPGRKYAQGSKYRYGFNGKENDNEVKGEGNEQDYGMRIYDPRLGRFFSVDPLTAEYAYFSPYQYAGNMPIYTVDVDGLEAESDPNINQKPLSLKDLPTVTVVSEKKLTGWQKFKAFGRGFVKAVVTTVVVVAVVAAVVASAGAAGPFIVAGVSAYGAYEVGKTGYEVISGKEAYTGRKLSEEERYERGGSITGGLLAGGFSARAGIRSGKVTKGILETSPVETAPATQTRLNSPEQFSEFIDAPENLPSASSFTEVKWNLGESVVTKGHHNWNKIFGNNKVSLSDVQPIVNEAVGKGTWETTGVIRGKGGKIIGDKVQLIQEVNGNKIWVGGTKEYSSGKIIINNAAVQ